MSKLDKIEKLSPFLARKIWGTRELTALKGEDLSIGPPVGESLEVSCLKSQASSLMRNNIGLDELATSEQLPFLIKIIDTSDDLSIQVHPEDEYAKRVEGSLGKTECWLILDALDGAGIYLGLKEETTQERLKEAIENSEDVSALLNFYPVRRGDFFYVPAGSIHAIGKGIRLLEVQQNSGVTYRVWDWNRLDDKGVSRELHISKALDVISFEKSKNNKEYFQFKKELFELESKQEIVAHRDFIADLYKVNTGKEDVTISGKIARYSAIHNLQGSLQVTRGSFVVELKQYESLLIDYLSSEDISINAIEDSVFVHVS